MPLVKIKPNHFNKTKWYYGRFNALEDQTGNILHVEESTNVRFAGQYQWVDDDTRFIEKQDTELIQP